MNGAAIGRIPVVVWALCCAIGCASPPPSGSAWVQVTEVFSKLISKPQVKSAQLSQQAYRDLEILRHQDADRLRFVSLVDYQKNSAERGQATAVLTIDGWPFDVTFDAVLTAGGWMISNITNPMRLNHNLGLLSPTGLPVIASTNQWTGGLSGRDDQNRPNAAVLLSGDGHRVSIDGGALMVHTADTLRRDIGAAFAARKRLSSSVFATYQPHVALALPKEASAMAAINLVAAASRSGATSIQALVRTEDGRGWLSMAVTQTQAGVHPPHRTLRISKGRVSMSLKGAHQAPLDLGPIATPGKIVLEVQRLSFESNGQRSFVVLASDDTTYGTALNLISTLHKIDPRFVVTLGPSP